MESLAIYLKLIRISMRSRMQYRADFIFGILATLLLNITNLGLISILVDRFIHLNGWGMWEIVFLYSLWMLAHSFYSLLFWHFNTLEDHLIQGTFDQFLTRPVSPLVQFLGREIQYLGIGDILFGLSGFALAYHHLQLDWSIWLWGFFVICIVSGTMIEMALSWMFACIAFWTGRSMTASFLMMRVNMLVQQYPIDIFGIWFRVVVTGLLPLAFMNYYPSIVLLDKTDNLSMPWIAYMSPIVAILLLLLGSYVWKRALIRYGSSGS